MSSDLRSELEAQAKDHGRSMNAEIIARLQKSLEPPSSALAWADLVEMLHVEAQKRGAEISITIK